MKVLSHQLTGPALAYAVAKALEIDVVAVIADGVPEVWPNDNVAHYNGDSAFNNEDGEPRYRLENGAPVGLVGSPVELSQQFVGEIIDETGISTLWRAHSREWWACTGDPNDDETLGYTGSSRSEAAMRALVVAKFSEVVDVPAVLAQPRRAQKT